MLIATVVTDPGELVEIHQLNQQNLKQHLDKNGMEKEGFVSWLYDVELLQQMHDLASTVIVKNNDRVVGYALTTPKEASKFHPDLKIMFANLQALNYKHRPLFSYHFYCMG